MANNNVQNVKFLRNGTLFESRSAAKTALEAKQTNLTVDQDGSIILARYSASGSVLTLAGVIYATTDVKTITIIDVEGSSADVEALRQEINAKLGEGITSSNTASAQLSALSGTSSDASGVTSVWGAKAYAYDLIGTLDVTDTAVEGSYVSQVSETDGKISVSRVALPNASSVAGDNKVVTDVTQSKGAITATASNITSVKLAGYAEGTDTDIAATDTLGDALGKLQAQINAMDLAVVSGDGEVITAVSEDDGKVSASKTVIKDVKLTGYVKDTSATGAISATDDIEGALSKLENKAAAITIASDDKTIKVTTSATGTDVAVNIDGTTLIKNASTGVISSDLKIQKITQTEDSEWAAEYQLVYGSSNQPIGEKIQVARDQFLKSASYSASTQTLYLEVQNISGGTTVIPVDFSAAVIEAEAGDGLYIKDDHSLNVGINNSSEAVTISDGDGGSTTGAVLVVDADSIKVQNIQNAIDYKVSTLDATVGSTSIASGEHVAVQVVETDGVLTTLTVTENDIASAQGLADEITARTNADTELSNRIGTGVTAANTATAQLAALSGTSSDTSGVTSVAGAKAYAKVYADEKVAAVVDGLNATVSGETTDGKVNVKVTESNGVITAVDVVGTDIASAQGLADEISHRKTIDGVNGNAYTADTNAHYISGASSLYGADQALDTALNSVDNAMLTGVAAGNGVEVTTKENKSQTISAKVNGDGGILVDNAGLHLGTIDCGTY